MNTTTIGVDIAKSVFQVSMANSAGRIIDRKRLSRAQFQRFLAEQPSAALVMEACATSHHWARTAQGHGHRTRLLHAQYVRPYVRRNKTDAADCRRTAACLSRSRSQGSAGQVRRPASAPRAAPDSIPVAGYPAPTDLLGARIAGRVRDLAGHRCFWPCGQTEVGERSITAVTSPHNRSRHRGDCRS